MREYGSNINLPSLDNLFSSEQERQDAKLEKIQILPLTELHPFRNHPFQVRDDDEMDKMVDSVKEYGVMTPAVVRPRQDGGYEIVAGHRRCHASQRAGVETMPCIVRDMDDDTAIILNQPSLEKFENKVKPGGILIYDGYGIINPPTRKDIKVYRIDAMDAANEMNNAKAFNMIVLGGLLKLRPIVTLENVIKGLKKTLPERHHHLIPMNEEAIKKGMELIREV